jgi:hypothetical protein
MDPFPFPLYHYLTEDIIDNIVLEYVFSPRTTFSSYVFSVVMRNNFYMYQAFEAQRLEIYQKQIFDTPYYFLSFSRIS